MELQFKKGACRCLTRALRDIASQELTQEVRLTDGMPDIGRVISGWGQMVLRSKEWRDDTVTLTGGVMVWILYAPEDGSEPRCMDAWIPYQLRWEHLDGSREGPARISPLLRFVDARAVAPRKMMVRVGAAALAEGYCPSEFELYSPEELPEDIEVLRRTYPVRLPKEAGEKAFQMDEDLTLNGAVPEQLICFYLRPEMTDARVLSNKIVFRGNANLHLIYRCREGRIRTHDFELPFSQYSELEGQHSPDATADVWPAATSLELDLDENGALRVKCALVAQYLVDDRELVELIEDAYSPSRPVEPRMESLIMPAILEDRQESVRVEQTLAGHNGDVVDANFQPDFPRQQRAGDQTELELPGMFQVLYYGEDGTLQSGNARWEGRMSIPAGEDSRIDARLQPVTGVNAVAEGGGLSMNGQMRLSLRTTGEGGLPMAAGLEVGEVREPDSGRPSLILCRPAGESLWHLAKRCGSTVEAIRSANSLDAEPEGNRMLLIPVK